MMRPRACAAMGPSRIVTPRQCSSSTRQPRPPCRRPSPPSELIAVTPGRELWAERPPDAHQLETLVKTREPDMLRRIPLAHGAESALAVLHGLPALFQRREIPALTLAANDPEPALSR